MFRSNRMYQAAAAERQPLLSTSRPSTSIVIPNDQYDGDTSPNASRYQSPIKIQNTRHAAREYATAFSLFKDNAGFESLSWKETISHWLERSIVGRYFELLDVALNISLVCLYVLNTTYDEHLPDFNYYLDGALSAFCYLQWFPRFIFSTNPISQIYFTMLSILSLVPPILSLALTNHPPFGTGYLDAGPLIFLYPFRFARLHLSVLRVLQPARNIIFSFSAITQKAIRLSMSILVTLLTVSAFVHIARYLDPSQGDVTFLEVFYAITVSSTSGLTTNILGNDTFSRFVIFYVMVTGAIFLPPALAELLSLIRSKSRYDRSFKPKDKDSHVVICGSFHALTIQQWVKEFFSEDFGPKTLRTKVVLLSSAEPSEDMKSILSNPLYAGRMQYVKGSVMNTRSLAKAHVSTAESVFILNDGGVNNEPENLMRSLSIRRYLQSERRPRIWCQVADVAHKSKYEGLVDYAVSLDELKQGILAQNALVPGFCTILQILVESISDSNLQQLLSMCQDKQELLWLKEYLRGSRMEIYAITLPDFLRDSSFNQAVSLIYAEFGAILFALGLEEREFLQELGMKDRNYDSKIRILLNPFDYQITGNETAYILAGNQATASRISQWSFTSRRDLQLEDPMQTDHHVNSPRLAKLVRKSTSDLVYMGAEETPVDAPSSISPISDHMRETGIHPSQRNLTSLPEFIDKNIVVCITEDHCPNLTTFIKTLRRFKDVPVVILCNNAPHDEQWEDISPFGNVFHLSGSPLSPRDLRRALITKALRAVVIGPQVATMKRAADADVIFTVLNIESITRDVFITIELIHKENAMLLGRSRWGLDVPGKALLPASVGGHILVRGSLNSVMVNAHYHRGLLELVERLVLGPSEDDANDKLVRIQLISIPEYWDSKYFEEYFLAMNPKGVLPIALYRYWGVDDGEIRYLLLNPCAKERIRVGDRCYVLANTVLDDMG